MKPVSCLKIDQLSLRAPDIGRRQQPGRTVTSTMQRCSAHPRRSEGPLPADQTL